MSITISRSVAEKLNTPCSTKTLQVAWWSVLSLSLLAHLILLLFTQGAAPDIHNYLVQAQTVLHRRNVYDVTREYPYPPVWIWLVAGARWLAGVFAAWFATTMTMSAQYTLWILPFLCLALLLEAVTFSLCALVGILAYYAQPLVRGALIPLPQATLTALSRPGMRLLRTARRRETRSQRWRGRGQPGHEVCPRYATSPFPSRAVTSCPI